MDVRKGTELCLDNGATVRLTEVFSATTSTYVDAVALVLSGIVDGTDAGGEEVMLEGAIRDGVCYPNFS